jgi:YD repeat-containing protein
MVTRYDVTTSASTSSTMKYNTAGSVVSSTDALQHTVVISYADAFAADGITLDAARPFTALAYPTTITDPDGFASSVRYSYDFGAPTWKQTPPPNANLTPPQTKLAYDSFGRLERVTNLVNNAYTRYEYPSSQNRVDTYGTIEAGKGEARSFVIADGHGRTIASASAHPSLIGGGFSGQLFLYDKLGRAIKTSNPTDTSADGTPTQWAATGDDATANQGLGWLYTQQTYDWKGRPLVTTNTDGTTKQASYTGCGCAGGAVVTLTDEGTMTTGEFKRRQQKIYSDVLGRTVKAETYNWQDPSVYSTTVNTYNARDQVTLTRQYAGPEGAATYQDTTLTYDGYGHLIMKHAPEQQVDANNSSSSDHTTWNYNPDDTVEWVKDPRGATQTFTYNNRHLVKTISYSAPAGINSTSPVSYDYDAVGNRTSMTMTDGTGSVSYEYDQLSRLKTETRTITGVGIYPLNYTYNLAGAVTSVTDPFGAQVSYNFDGAGKVTSVTGSGFAGVSSYASNIQYRAWGGQKSVSYGDNKSATTSYDARMRPSVYEMPGLREQFQYYDDGRLKQMTDLDDRNQDIGYPDTARHFSRARSYDQVGRLTSDKGATSSTFPLNQNYAHDAFNNATARYGTYYYQNQTSDSASYSNNRRTNWTYYADGQVKHSPLAFDVNFNESMYRDWTYDAAGRMVQVQETITSPSSVSTYTTGYDGDGQAVRESTTTPTYTTTGYMIRSSVLGGRVLTRLDSVGAKQKTVFDVDGRLTAVQLSISGSNSLAWTHIDPLGLSEAGDTKPVYDALGNYVPWQHVPSGAPPNAYPPFSPNFGGLGASFGSAQDKGCVFNDRPISCSDLAHKVGIGIVSAIEILQGGIASREGAVGSLGLGMFYIDGRNLPGDPGGYSGTAKGPDGTDIDIIRGNTNSTKGHYVFFLQSVAPTPQNSASPEVLNKVRQTLQDPKCAQFASAILGAVSKKNPVYPAGGTLLDVFNAFLNQPKPHDLFTTNLPPGSLGYGNPIGSIRESTAAIALPGRPDADGVIGELFHLAARNSHYTDKQLAAAVRQFPQYADVANKALEPNVNIYDPRYKAPSDWTEENQGGYSAYFHYAQINICFTAPASTGMKRLIN